MHRRRRGDNLEKCKINTNVDKSHFFEFSYTPTRGQRNANNETCKNTKLGSKQASKEARMVNV